MAYRILLIVPRSTRVGATLIEMLVGCGIFVFLMLSSIAIMKIGTNGYKGVESKADVVRQLNRFESDIIQELKRASLATVGVYTPNNDFHWAIWFKTAMNSPNNVDSAGNPKGNPIFLGDPLVQITRTQGNQVVPVMQRYVLYYVMRMDAREHLDLYGFRCASYGSPAGPDTTCPHKWLIKKDLYLLSAQTTGNDTIGPQSSPSAVANLRSLTTDSTLSGLMDETDAAVPTSVVHRVQVVAQNVLSFEVTRLAVDPTNPLNPPGVNANGPIILFDLKVFKSLSASNVEVGTSAASSVATTPVSGVPGGQMVDITSVTDKQGTVTLHTSSSVNAGMSSYTIQLDNRVIPENP